MDIQLKRGMLDVCVLAAIKDEDSYGYQIIKDMKPYVTISESTLYPILRRLEANAYLTVQSVEHNGRLRKYYHITDAGRARIDEFQEEWKELESIYRFIVREEPIIRSTPTGSSALYGTFPGRSWSNSCTNSCTGICPGHSVSLHGRKPAAAA